MIAGLPQNPFTLKDLSAAGGPDRLPDRIVSADGTTVIQRIERGIYRFSDVRMRAYVRIRHVFL